MPEAEPMDRSPVVLRTERLVLTMLPPSAGAALAQYQRENRAHLLPWSPPTPPGFFSADFWQWRLEENRLEYANDVSLRLQLLESDESDAPVIGQVSLTQYTRGPHQSCNLGYNVDHRFEGRGLMKEALGAALRHAFGPLAFHRIAANYMPTNERSGRLLRSLGFEVEGYARDYLYIAGAWRDHVLTALYNPDPSPPGVRAVSAPTER